MKTYKNTLSTSDDSLIDCSELLAREPVELMGIETAVRICNASSELLESFDAIDGISPVFSLDTYNKNKRIL